MENSQSGTERMRLITLSKAHMMTRLADERYFEKVMQAINEKKDDEFLEICHAVGIPKEMALNLWRIFMARDTLYADTWM